MIWLSQANIGHCENSTKTGKY